MDCEQLLSARICSFLLRRADTGEMVCAEVNFDFCLEPENAVLGSKMNCLMQLLLEVEEEAKLVGIAGLK